MKCIQCGADLEYFGLEESDDMVCRKCNQINAMKNSRADETRKATYKLLPIEGESSPPPPKGEREIASYIICSPFPPHKLSKNKKFTIGREVLNHLVLPSIDVSRFHAAIKWDNSAYVLSDLGSSNGTLVNQQPISNHALENGDKIQIGNNVLMYQEVSVGSSPIVGTNKETQQLGANRKWMELNREALREQSEVYGVLRGKIESMNLTSVLQLLGLDGKTGTLKLTKGEEKAAICLIEGDVVHCEYEQLTDKQAFFEIMRWERGQFEFMDNQGPEKITMSKKVEWLLFETARILDEENRQ